MASYPSSPNKYPGTPNKYPSAPAAYPSSSNIHGYPSGSGPPIDISQSVQFQAIASTIVPIDVSQAISATFVATKGLIAAQLDVDPSKNITLGGTMRLTGTSPAVTFTGTLTFATACPGIKVEITTGGAVGVGVFRVSYDNGSNWAHSSVTIASTYALDGAANGVTLNFAAGTYVLNDTYEGTVSSVTSADTNAYVFSQATAASQPVYRVSTGSGARFFFNGGQTLECSTAGLIAYFTNDPAMTVMMKFAPTTASRAEDMFTVTQTGGTNGSHRYGKAVTGTGRLTHTCVNDAASSANSNQTRGVDDLTNGGITKFCWYGPGSNGGTNCKVNDANLNPNAGTWNPGTVTPTRATLGATHDNAVRRQLIGDIYRLVVFNTQLSASDQTAWNAAL